MATRGRGLFRLRKKIKKSSETADQNSKWFEEMDIGDFYKNS